MQQENNSVWVRTADLCTRPLYQSSPVYFQVFRTSRLRRGRTTSSGASGCSVT